MMQPNPMLVLSGALSFSAADLYANRAGILTPRQRDYLLKLRNQAFEGWFAGTLLVIAGGIFFHLRLIAILFGLACMVTALLTIYLRYEEDLQSRVEMINGRLGIRAGIKLPGTGYQMMVGRETFSVSRRVKAAFTGGAYYRLYYTAGTHTLLAAELMG